MVDDEKDQIGFVGYVGDPDLHDGHVTGIERNGDNVRVCVKGASSRTLAVEFDGVESLNSNRAVGMMLYALCKFHARRPWRRFVFANWDDEGDARLEIVAREFRVVET